MSRHFLSHHIIIAATKGLEQLRSKDIIVVKEGIVELLSYVNDITNGREIDVRVVAQQLLHRAGIEVPLDFAFIAACTAASDSAGDFTTLCLYYPMSLRHYESCCPIMHSTNEDPSSHTLSGDLCLYNPTLNPIESDGLICAAMLMMMTANRITHATLALLQARNLLKVLRQLRNVMSQPSGNTLTFFVLWGALPMHHHINTFYQYTHKTPYCRCDYSHT